MRDYYSIILNNQIIVKSYEVNFSRRTYSPNFTTLQLLLAQSDYQMIMSILSGNLAEGQSKDAAVQSISSTQIVKSSESKAIDGTMVDVEGRSLPTIEEDPRPKTHIFLKFTFTMEQLIINLFTGKSQEVSKF